MKPIEDIKTGLAKKYDGIMKQVEGYSYIPWNEAVKHADELFDPDGYDVEIKKVWREDVANTDGVVASGYAGIVRVTVHPEDGRPFVREGLGFAEIVFTQPKSWIDQRTGEEKFVPARALIDTSIKGVASRALLRALVLLGDGFGLFLYDKEDTQASTGASGSSYGQVRGNQNQTSNEPITEGQRKMLGFQKVPDQIVNQLNKRTASQMISDIKDGKKRDEVYAPYQQAEPTKTEYAWDDEKKAS